MEPWRVYTLSELLKAASIATGGGISGHTEKAAVRMVAFPCGDGILSPSQKMHGNLGDRLRCYFPKATQIRLSISHWCLLLAKVKKILLKEVSSTWREFLSVKITATFLHTPHLCMLLGIMSGSCCAPPTHTGKSELSCTEEVVMVGRQNLGRIPVIINIVI